MVLNLLPRTPFIPATHSTDFPAMDDPANLRTFFDSVTTMVINRCQPTQVFSKSRRSLMVKDRRLEQTSSLFRFFGVIDDDVTAPLIIGSVTACLNRNNAKSHTWARLNTIYIPRHYYNRLRVAHR